MTAAPSTLVEGLELVDVRVHEHTHAGAANGPANGSHYGAGRVEYDVASALIIYEEYHPFGTSAYRAVDSTIEVTAKRYRYAAAEPSTRLNVIVTELARIQQALRGASSDMTSGNQQSVSRRIEQLRIEFDAASRETERLSHEHEAIALEIEAALDEDASCLPELDRKLHAVHEKLIDARSAKQNVRARLDCLYNAARLEKGGQ